MSSYYIEPSLLKTKFTCPHCSAITQNVWTKTSAYKDIINQGAQISDLLYCLCTNCQNYSLWKSPGELPEHLEVSNFEAKMIFPDTNSNSPPNDDIPDKIREIYNEASSIMVKSHRAAAAMLRLCAEQLCQHLLNDHGDPNYEQYKLNDATGELVKTYGLPVDIRDMLDILRITGNATVHTGEIILDDSIDSIPMLFDFINLIAENQITQPKKSQLLKQNLHLVNKTKLIKETLPPNSMTIQIVIIYRFPFLLE